MFDIRSDSSTSNSSRSSVVTFFQLNIFETVLLHTIISRKNRV